MKSQDISRFKTVVDSLGSCNNGISLLPMINPLTTPQYQSILGNMPINCFELPYKNDNLINPISSNFLYSPIGNHDYLSNMGGNIRLFPKLAEIISPISVENNNLPLKLSCGIDNLQLPSILSSVGIATDIFRWSYNLTSGNNKSISDQIKDISIQNIPSSINRFGNISEEIDQIIKNLSISKYNPSIEFNRLFVDYHSSINFFKTNQEVPLSYITRSYVTDPSLMLPSPILSLNSFKENLFDFEPLLYKKNLGVSWNNIITKETAYYLEKNCITEISANNRDIKLLFKHSTHSFHYDACLSKISHIVELSEQDIASYNKLIIKNNHKQNQGKGGVNKRKDEKAFFLAKFKELRGLDHKSKDRDIVHKIWDEHNSIGKELSKLSKARGIITLMEWYREYIAKSA
jgi:hypothetical protein